MRTKSLIIFLIGFLAIRLPAQNSASHQVTIRIIHSNSVSVSDFSADKSAMDASAEASTEASAPASLLKWSTDGKPKKVTICSNENRPLLVETGSVDVGDGNRLKLSNVNQNTMAAGLRGNGQTSMKWLPAAGNGSQQPVEVAFTVVEM